MPQEEQVKKEEQQITQPELMDVDIDGITIKVPVDQAKKMIEKRQEKHQLFKEISDKAKKYENELAETKRLSEAQKAALEGRLAESEQLFSKKSEEKLANIQKHLINREIESVLLSDDAFIKDSKEDAIKLLKSDMEFKLSDDGISIMAGDKPAKDAIAEWIKSKPLFRKATGTQPTGGKVGPKTRETKKDDPQTSLTKGLGAFLNGKK